MKVSRSIRERWRSTVVLIAVAAVMLAVTITPALAAILPGPANLANTTGNYQVGGD